MDAVNVLLVPSRFPEAITCGLVDSVSTPEAQFPAGFDAPLFARLVH